MEQELPTDLISEDNQQTGTRELTNLSSEANQQTGTRELTYLSSEAHQQTGTRVTNRSYIRGYPTDWNKRVNIS